MNSDFSELLQALNGEGVDYLVIGGYAVGKHTEPRYTKDLDIWIRNSRENAERVFRALAEFGAPLSNVSIEDFTDPEMIYQIGIEPSRIDILAGIQGLSFTDCWERKVEAFLDDIDTHFISIDDLIANKRSVGRRQDLLDVDALELKKSLEALIHAPLTKTSD